MNDLVSIVLPVHNGARYLAQSIESCLHQTHSHLELIIVNDGSTDDTASIIERYAGDSRVRCLTPSRQLGLPAALNFGFQAANGAYLTWTSDDNMYEPFALERLVRELKKCCWLDLVYSNCHEIDSMGNITSTDDCRTPDFLIEFQCVGACFLYRRSMAEKVGKYSEDVFLAEDYDFFLRAYLAGCRMRALPDVLYRYRKHSESLSELHSADSIRSIAERVRRRHLTPSRERWLVFCRRLRRFPSVVSRLGRELTRKCHRQAQRGGIRSVVAFLAWRFYDRLCDWRLGIDTIGLRVPEQLGVDTMDSHAYEATQYAVLRKVFQMLRVKPETHGFLDYGAGMGRVVVVAGLRPFRRVIGVEISRALVQKARANVRKAASRLRSRTVEIFEANAATFNIPIDITILFLYNPFGAATLNAVLDRVQESLTEAPRELLMVVYNAEVFAGLAISKPWITLIQGPVPIGIDNLTLSVYRASWL